MKPIKTIATTVAFGLAVFGYAHAQGTLGDSGASPAVNGSIVESAPSAVQSVPSAVERTPSAVESSTTGSGSSSGTRTRESVGARKGSGAGLNATMGNGLDGTNHPPSPSTSPTGQ